VNDTDDFDDDAWLVEANKRARLRHRRKSWLQRFRVAQNTRREWINFGDIADWVSRESGCIEPDGEKRRSALLQLRSALFAGEFDANGISQVLFLSFRTRLTRLSGREWARMPESVELDHMLPCCWLQTDVAQAWFKRLRIEWPSVWQKGMNAPGSTDSQRIKRRGGRPQAYNWAPALARVDAYLDDNGIPKAGDGGQSALEKLVADHFSHLDKPPAESTIRDHVQRRITAKKRELGMEAIN
jgi:hypothetical protein